ncbi:class I SAM-dependent methyltransferase [Actinoplanes philippinensis]|uniref:class I SAM-dependent methyltransferase n=1 Tax=Actinoplanes philippinensis TaxID=35752 RepID=UPI003409B299
MDNPIEELRHAHDVLAGWYAERLAGALEAMPVDRAVLDLFGELTLAAGLGSEVADVGCGTGRLEPYLAARGLSPQGVDLSPGMIDVARRDHPAFRFEVADLRELPFPDASLAGVVCWYSLIFLAPPDRKPAFAELARVVKPGGHLVTAFKDGDGRHRRSGRSAGLGVEFDSYWLSAGEMTELAAGAGFDVVFRAGRPPGEGESCPQGYLLLRKA